MEGERNEKKATSPTCEATTEGRGSPRSKSPKPQGDVRLDRIRGSTTAHTSDPTSPIPHGDCVRPGGARHRRAGRVRRRLRQRRRRGPPHPREAPARRRGAPLLRAGPLHLPRPPRRRRNHLPLYGQRHLRKKDPFSLPGRHPDEVHEELRQSRPLRVGVRHERRVLQGAPPPNGVFLQQPQRRHAQPSTRGSQRDTHCHGRQHREDSRQRRSHLAPCRQDVHHAGQRFPLPQAIQEAPQSALDEERQASSCVDGCHSSATLLDHFSNLRRPFATIMQIMNNGFRMYSMWVVVVVSRSGVAL